VPFIIPHFRRRDVSRGADGADACRNIHLDTSSSNGWTKYTPGLTLDAVFKAALPSAGVAAAVRTDSSFFPRGWQQGFTTRSRRIVERLAISAADAALIFGGNFERLFPAAG
jgi:hypothetical protein